MRLIDAGALLENLHKKRKPQEGADNTNQRHRYMQFLGDCEAIRNAPTIDAVPVDMIKGRINDLKKILIDTDEDDVDLIWNLRIEIGTLRGLLEMWAERKEE